MSFSDYTHTYTQTAGKTISSFNFSNNYFSFCYDLPILTAIMCDTEMLQTMPNSSKCKSIKNTAIALTNFISTAAQNTTCIWTFRVSKGFGDAL